MKYIIQLRIRLDANIDIILSLIYLSGSRKISRLKPNSEIVTAKSTIYVVEIYEAYSTSVELWVINKTYRYTDIVCIHEVTENVVNMLFCSWLNI
jgi:hypothetical protein